MGEAGARDVQRISTPRRGVERLAVRLGGELVAHVEVGSSRRTIEASGVDQPPAVPATLPAEVWPAASADRAAAARWADHHAGVLTVSCLELVNGAGDQARAALEAVGGHLASSGSRRLDIRAPAGDPLLPWLHGPGWMQGTASRAGAGSASGAVVVSRSLRYPWSRSADGAEAPAPRSALPLPVRRLGRRLSTMHPAQAPELARTAAAEIGAAVRFRYAPGSPRVLPIDGAPPGTFPFAVTRYRTIRTALALVPPGLRSTRFVDVGCGDGRVLREAVDRGWSAVHGRELDPELGARARAAVGHHGTVDVGDGLVAPLPDDAGVVYLNNPFQTEGLTRLAGLLADSLDRRPRPLVIIYINPRPLEPLTSRGFALVQCTPAFSVLTFVSG